MKMRGVGRKWAPLSAWSLLIGFVALLSWPGWAAAQDSNAGTSDGASTSEVERERRITSMSTMVESSVCVDVVPKRRDALEGLQGLGLEPEFSEESVERCDKLLEEPDSVLSRLVVMAVRQECEDIEQVTPAVNRISDGRVPLSRRTVVERGRSRTVSASGKN